MTTKYWFNTGTASTDWYAGTWYALSGSSLAVSTLPVSGDTVLLYTGTLLTVSAADVATNGVLPTLDIQFNTPMTLDLTGETINQTSTIETPFSSSGTVILRGSSTDAGLLASKAGVTLGIDIETASASQLLTITSTGTLLAINSGTVAITGTAGASVANAGVIQAGTISSGSALAGTVTDSRAIDNTGAINVSAFSTGSFTGAVTNEATGSITDNQGTLNVLAPLTNAGSLTDSQGAVTIGGSLTNTGAIAVNTLGTLTLSGGVANQSAGRLLATNSGTVNATGTAGITNAGLIQAGTVSGGTASVGVMTFAPAIDNTGSLVVNALSTMMLSGALTNEAAGTVTDSQGTLTVGGSLTTIGAIPVNTLGTLTVNNVFTNQANATLTDTSGTVSLNGNVTNAGTLSESQGALNINGSLSNTGVISASNGTLTLQGSESGAGSFTVVNGATLQFTGATGNTVGSSGTMTIGTLTGSVASTGTLTSTQIVDNSGALNVQSLSSATLTAAATNEATGSMSVSAGTLSFNGGLSNKGTLTEAGGSLAVLSSLVNTGAVTQTSGTFSVANGLTNSGTVTLNGSDSITGGLSNSGLVTFGGGSLSITGGLNGNGTLSIGDSLTANVSGTVTASAKISFATGIGILSVGTPSAFAGTVTNMSGHDLIDLVGLANATATVNAGAVTVTQNGTTALTFTATGLTAGQLYSVSDGNGGTILTLKQAGTAGPINSIVNGPTGGATHHWAGTNPTVTYSFDPSNGGWTAAEQQSFINGLGLYSALAKINFTAATGGATGQIVFTRGTAGTAFTNLSFDTTSGLMSSANVVIGTSSLSFQNITTFGTNDATLQGGYGWDTVLHEIGHAVAFNHPGNYNETADLVTQQSYYLDTHQYTLMSYFGATYSGANTNANVVVGGVTNSVSINDQTPMLFDIAALQQVYGANTTTLAGGDTFGFNASAAITGNTALNSVYNFSSNGTPVVTIWDGGVNNTLDVSGFSQAGTVNLNAGGFSSIDGLTSNVAIAYGTTIDTAVGGSGNTTFVVNADSDVIKGGSGSNTVVFSGNKSAYSIAINNGTVTVASGGVTDTLTNVQSLQFADQTVAACFAAGTRIRTERGDVAIETLRAGEDWAITASGHAARIVWIGHRRTELARHPRPWDVMPVRIAAHAFGPGVPARDLLVSPDHAIFHDGLLVPARQLLNGASIAQERHERVTWYHVELEWHDAILAEGLATESYLDTGNRSAFDNGGPVRDLHADFAARTATARRIWAEQGMAPLVEDGPIVASLRAELIGRAPELGFETTAEAAPMLIVDGRCLAPQRRGNVLSFDLPDGARRITLASRRFAPADFDPTSEDRRTLGLAVTWLEIDGVAIATDSPVRGQGWHAPEAGWQWTDGAACLHQPGARVIRVGIEPLNLRHVERRTDHRRATA